MLRNQQEAQNKGRETPPTHQRMAKGQECKRESGRESDQLRKKFLEVGERLSLQSKAVSLQIQCEAPLLGSWPRATTPPSPAVFRARERLVLYEQANRRTCVSVFTSHSPLKGEPALLVPDFCLTQDQKEKKTFKVNK